MTFIDTHCHIYDEAFQNDRDEAVDRAIKTGVETMLLPDIDHTSTPLMDSLAQQYPMFFRCMAGLHPTSVKEDYKQELQHVYSRLQTHCSGDRTSMPTIVAIGEIGMDLYWDKTFEAEQYDALQQQLQWAVKFDLPVALHIRKAYNEVMNLLRDMECVGKVRGVMHCFGGSVKEARRAVEMGFMLGIGGVVTFKNAGLADVVSDIPLDYLLLETDAPYLAPTPYRGKRNESGYLPIIAQKVADIKGVALSRVAEQTTENAKLLFRL